MDWFLYGWGATPVNNSVRVGYDVPSGKKPETGANKQTVTVRVRKTGVGSPNARVELWETGGVSPIATVIPDTPISTTTFISGTWDSSVLSDQTGNSVEFKVVGTGVSGGTLEVGAISWYAALIDSLFTTYNQTLAATIAPLSSFIKQANVIRAAISPVTAALRKTTNKTLPTTLGNTSILLKKVGKQAIASVIPTADARKTVSKAVNTNATPTAAATKLIGKTITSSVGVTAAIKKSAGKVLSYAIPAIAAVQKRAGVSLRSDVTASAENVRKTVSKYVTASTTPVPTLIKATTRRLSVTVSSVTTLTKRVMLLWHSEMAVDTNMVKNVKKILTDAVTLEPTIAHRVARLLTLAAQVAPTASVTRTIGKLLETNLAPLSVFSRRVNKLLSRDITITPTVIKTTMLRLYTSVATDADITVVKVFLLLLSASVGTSAGIVKDIGKSLVVSVTPTAHRIINAYIKLRADVVVQGVANKAVSKTLQVISAVNAFIASGRVVNVLLTAVVGSEAALQKSVNLIMGADIASVATLSKDVKKRLIGLAGTTVSVTKDVGKRLRANTTLRAFVTWFEELPFVETVITVALSPKLGMDVAVREAFDTVVSVVEKKTITISLGRHKYTLSVQILPKPEIRIDKV